MDPVVFAALRPPYSFSGLIHRLGWDSPTATPAQPVNKSVGSVDNFGNLISNIGRLTFERFAHRFQQCRLSIKIERRAPLSLYNAYAQAAPGAPLAIFGSFDLLEIAVRDGNAAAYFGAPLGTRVSISAAGSRTTPR